MVPPASRMRVTIVASVSGVPFQRRGAVHHRDAGKADIVLQCDLLARKLAVRGALDLGLDVPGVELVFLAFGAIARQARMIHRRNVIRHRVDRVIGGVVRLHQRVIGLQFLVAHMHAEVFGDAAQLIERGSSDCHGFSPS
jgi:hypothetical protein